MKNRITRFLITSAAAISVLCLVVFSFLAYYMNKQSGDTIFNWHDLYDGDERQDLHAFQDDH